MLELVAVKAPVAAHVLDVKLVPLRFVFELLGVQSDDDPAVWLIRSWIFVVKDHEAFLARVLDHGFERPVVPVVVQRSASSSGSSFLRPASSTWGSLVTSSPAVSVRGSPRSSESSVASMFAPARRVHRPLVERRNRP